MSVKHVLAFAKFSEIRIERDQSILCAKIQCIVNAPIYLIDKRNEISNMLRSEYIIPTHLADFPSGVKQSLQHITQ